MNRKRNIVAVTIAFSCLLLAPAFAGTTSGVDLYGQKNYREALQAFENQIKLNPTDSTAYYYSGLCYQQLGNIAQAKVMYRYVVKLSPNSQIAKYAGSILVKLDPSFRLPETKTESDKLKSTTNKDGALVITKSADSSLKTAEPAAAGELGKYLAEVNSAVDRSKEPPTDPSELAKLPERARIFCAKRNGSLYMPAEINGRQIQMIFDTGAPNVVVSLDDLREMNIRPPEGPPSGQTGGASNSSRIACWDMYATVKVGSIIRNKVKIQVLASSAAPPLLGQSFFRDFDYTIESDYSCIEFKRKGKYRSDVGQINVVPFRFREKGNRIIVDIEINGKKFPAMFDTGNSASGLNFHSLNQMKRYGVPMPNNATTISTSGVSGSGSAIQLSIQRLKLGPIDMYDAPGVCNLQLEPPVSDADKALVQNSKIHPFDEIMPPLLGQGILRGWRYTIDMDNKLIHFKR